MISFDQMNRLAKDPHSTNKFWGIILDSLTALEKTILFDKTLEVMNVSDNYIISSIAQQLSKSSGRPIRGTIGKLIN